MRLMLGLMPLAAVGFLASCEPTDRDGVCEEEESSPPYAGCTGVATSKEFGAILQVDRIVFDEHGRVVEHMRDDAQGDPVGGWASERDALGYNRAYWYDADGDGEWDWSYAHQRDEEACEDLRREYYDAQGALTSFRTYEYLDGRLAVQRDEQADPAAVPRVLELLFTYDEEGEWIEQLSRADGVDIWRGTRERTAGPSREIEVRALYDLSNGGALAEWHRLEYDAQDRVVVWEEDEDGDGEVDTLTETTYDLDGGHDYEELVTYGGGPAQTLRTILHDASGRRVREVVWQVHAQLLWLELDFDWTCEPVG